MSDFVSVLDAASLAPGEGRTVHVRGRDYAVYNRRGEFFAVDDLCPHRGGSLGAGMVGADGLLYCPMHGWGFDLKTGACPVRPDRPVQTYRTRVVAGQVQIQVPTTAANPQATYEERV